jgi:hypothetical protein
MIGKTRLSIAMAKGDNNRLSPTSVLKAKDEKASKRAFSRGRKSSLEYLDLGRAQSGW